MKLPTPGAVIWNNTYYEKLHPLSRPRFAKGHVYQPLDNQKGLRQWMRENGPDTIEGDAWLECYFMVKGNQEPDVDNMLKAVCDALQSSGCITNDRRIVGITAVRATGFEQHATTIILRGVEYFDADTTPVPEGSNSSDQPVAKKPSKSRGSASNGSRKKPR